MRFFEIKLVISAENDITEDNIDDKLQYLNDLFDFDMDWNFKIVKTTEKIEKIDNIEEIKEINKILEETK